jgi:dTDP-4-amino-4,6-dideoxygalactose transaminase
VKGPGNLARFDYWLNTYRAMATMAEVACARGQLDAAMAKIRKTKDKAARLVQVQAAIAIRAGMARLWEQMLGYQVAATDTPGELGTIVNLEQHNRVRQKFIALYDKELAEVLGTPLPPAEPARTYTGPARIIVPTVRGQVRQNERLNLRVIALDAAPVARVELYWRPLGSGPFVMVPARHVGRAVYAATLAPAPGGIEYYVRAVNAAGKEIVWPATAPDICQTVVVQ